MKNKQKAYEKRIQCQETTIIQRKIYWIICTTKINKNPLVQIYQEKQMQLFLNKLILQEK